MNVWKQGIVFMRHTGKDGKGYIEAHSCWNTDLFIAEQDKAATKAGGSVEVVTLDDYVASKRRTR